MGGEKVEVAIKELQLDKRKVVLSIKYLEEQDRDIALKTYGSEASGKNLPFSSLSDDLKKNLEKFTDIILNEIKRTLKKGDRVELRGFGVFSTNTQKARLSRNPKTGGKVNTPEKKTIHFKMSKDLFKKLNNNEE